MHFLFYLPTRLLDGTIGGPGLLLATPSLRLWSNAVLAK